MVPAPRYYEFPGQGSPTKSGFPADGASAAPDVSQYSRGNGSRLSATNPDTCVAIVGVGFVGESLLHEFSRVLPCIGYDISPKRIAALHTPFIEAPQPVELTTDATALSRATHFLIAVPTLLRSDRSVNLDYVQSAISTVFTHARPGSAIVLESSVSVGTTRRLLSPHSQHFHIGMSPERVDPGRISPAPRSIPKLVSGLTPLALTTISNLYSKVFDTVIPLSSPETAEMTKLFENSFRMVNIAYVNEMADLARKQGIDPFEMINAADTKPYGFMKFTPGLGVGGHCIPVNPYYLFEGAGGNPKQTLPVLEKATRGMWARPKKLARQFHRRAMFAHAAGSAETTCQVVSPKNYVAAARQTVATEVNVTAGNRLIPAKQPRILVVGIGFKPGQSVLSCSPGLSFAETLRELGCHRLAFFDPLVDERQVGWMEKLPDQQWRAEYIDREFDGVAVCCVQRGVDLSVIEGLGKCRNMGHMKGRSVFVRSYVSN